MVTAESPADAAAPLARVRGEPLLECPADLYIPPDALEVILEAFEGPLDLLLYLIKRQNLDLLDIPIASITAQYMEYIGLMQELRLELAAEYLLMAAWLAEIKSRLLLPRPPRADAEEGEDPRAELVRRLQEYERIKRAAEELDALPRLYRDVYPVVAPLLERQVRVIPPHVGLNEMLAALAEVLRRAEHFSHHHVQREPLSVRERMSRLLADLADGEFAPFSALFAAAEGRRGVVVTFLALLELVRERLVELVQVEPYAPIHIRRRGA